jgi:hypothetical protein
LTSAIIYDISGRNPDQVRVLAVIFPGLVALGAPSRCGKAFQDLISSEDSLSKK